MNTSTKVPLNEELGSLHRKYAKKTLILLCALAGFLLLDIASVITTICAHGALGVGKTIVFCILETIGVPIALLIALVVSWSRVVTTTGAEIDVLCRRSGISRPSLVQVANRALSGRTGLMSFLKVIDKDQAEKVEFLSSMVTFDLRSEEERKAESDAQSDLGGEDEEYAHQICALQKETDERNHVKEDAKKEIRRIGEDLGANGGDPRMQRVAYRVKALGGSSRLLEVFWEGICGWMS